MSIVIRRFIQLPVTIPCLIRAPLGKVSVPDTGTGGDCLCAPHPHPHEVIVTNYNLSWSRNPPQSSCAKQPVPLWGKAKRPTGWAAETGAAEPLRCAGVCGGVGEPHGAGRSNRAMGNKGSYFSFNSNISKFVADFFCLLDPLSFLCKESGVSKERKIDRPLCTNVFPQNVPNSTLWV